MGFGAYLAHGARAADGAFSLGRPSLVAFIVDFEVVGKLAWEEEVWTLP